ncbi:hypothetical protein PISL3812_01389 [Talaromyces islandicus]|uniref:Metallo-beta-lactamase domain-containing protein n=1 Tax=Talaromyces islandicus TaxID=28573 RepID=A0A0U1LM03_TALIS|nr:hypothetical protein PISL3812_01389 [Talaromyces islandicus]
MSKSPGAMPDLAIPPSQNVVDVSVIDSTANVQVDLGFFVKDPMPDHGTRQCPSYVFLIENNAGKKAVFDLGLRPDTESFPPIIRKGVNQLSMHAEKNIATILQEDGRVGLYEIGSIILSHWHPDHIGDPSTFPSTTELVVGPGFRNAFLPGYPTDPTGLILESDYTGRQLREINFETGLRIGQFRAMDFFSDGSFYLLDSPGHAVGHMCALARTTPSTFIFIGSDSCHHCGALRPNKYLPLPELISPSPFSNPPHLQGTVCPGALVEVIHPKRSRSEPFYSRLEHAEGRDVTEAEATISKMFSFDASEDVFVMIAHDKSLPGVIEFFPKKANEWKEKGWKEASRWRFLEDFRLSAVNVSTPSE